MCFLSNPIAHPAHATFTPSNFLGSRRLYNAIEFGYVMSSNSSLRFKYFRYLLFDGVQYTRVLHGGHVVYGGAVVFVGRDRHQSTLRHYCDAFYGLMGTPAGLDWYLNVGY